jgi:glycosyltransferase involved in cell wall biosynthesis
MKVAHLDTGRTWRGGQRQVLLLLGGLRERGVACTLLAPRGPLLAQAAADGFDVRAWESRGDMDVAAMLRARSILKSLAPDVAHCHSGRAHALGVPAARWAGVPHVVVSRRVDVPIRHHPLSTLKYGWGVDRYLCISKGVRDVMRAGGVPDERMRVVRSGVTMERRRAPGDLRADLGIPSDAPVVGTVAALTPHKNHMQLLRSAKQVLNVRPDVHFVWFGEGGERAALEAERRTLGIESRVHMPGHRDGAVELLSQFDVFALPSRTEGLGTSLLDAQIAGVPVIASRTGGISEVIVDGVTGRMVDVGDVGGFAQAILDALEQPDTTARWVAAAHEHVKAFTADAMAEGTLAAYREFAR